MLLPYKIRFCWTTGRQQANLAAVTEAVAKLVEVVEATNRLGKISSNSVLGSIVSATNFRFGFGNLGKLSYRSHRGKTAIALIYQIISATLKLV